ncbi:uncharacterized protein F4822DRAFT_385366 [Hypoxylon trugodes]|uniref:uncharacterized protein n=1 Tax=Hypoxylon trugodes TaxID=326681 RepID=UPI0021A14854|nr:uncharacterized protein F4822DRAFT_385366 [Hypoxylon trugodes]KAI1393650.1 hypothetical protein F4822DRAFT_385366 [Hypoxylon trugodes]
MSPPSIQIPRKLSNQQHEQLFTCTFCWHLSRGPPHILGRSARLTCDSCFRGLIDLAIC